MQIVDLIAGGTGEIPHTIHQIFFGGESAVPPSYREYAESWRRLHPAWIPILRP